MLLSPPCTLPRCSPVTGFPRPWLTHPWSWSWQEPLSPFRRRLVTNVFNHLDAGNTGEVSLEDALGFFSPEKHPTVATSRRKPEDVSRDFMGTFPTYAPDGVVTLPALEAFYTDVGYGVGEDDEFQMVLWNCWSLGAKRARWVSSCRAVPHPPCGALFWIRVWYRCVLVVVVGPLSVRVIVPSLPFFCLLVLVHAILPCLALLPFVCTWAASPSPCLPEVPLQTRAFSVSWSA